MLDILQKQFSTRMYNIKDNGSFFLIEIAEGMCLLVDSLVSQHWNKKFLHIAVSAVDYKDRDGSKLKTPGNLFTLSCVNQLNTRRKKKIPLMLLGLRVVSIHFSKSFLSLSKNSLIEISSVLHPKLRHFRIN